MQTVVLKLDVHDDDRCKRNVMKIVSTTPGIDSISMNIKEQQLTLIGKMDPILIVKKLRKVFRTEVLSIGPVKEPEEKKDEPDNQAQMIDYMKHIEAYSYFYHPCYPKYYTY